MPRETTDARCQHIREKSRESLCVLFRAFRERGEHRAHTHTHSSVLKPKAERRFRFRVTDSQAARPWPLGDTVALLMNTTPLYTTLSLSLSLSLSQLVRGGPVFLESARCVRRPAGGPPATGRRRAGKQAQQQRQHLSILYSLISQSVLVAAMMMMMMITLSFVVVDVAFVWRCSSGGSGSSSSSNSGGVDASLDTTRPTLQPFVSETNRDKSLFSAAAFSSHWDVLLVVVS